MFTEASILNTSGEVTAKHFATRQVVRLRWAEGLITHVEVLSKSDQPEFWFTPGLFDIQVNGFGGVDFQADGLTEADMLTAVRALRRAGCTRLMVALITDEWDRLLNRLCHLRALQAACPELQTAIAGWHIEGPFLSAEPGFHGAHDPRCMLDPTPERIEELRHAAGDQRVLLTLAPERPGAIEAIRQAWALGMTVSLGHTNAPIELLQRARDAGASGFTHLGNACPQALDRHDNILWRVFETPGLTVSLIPDGFHVSPSLFRLAHQLLALEGIIYTTDAMAAAGAPPGRYRLGRLELETGGDGAVREPGKSNFAGSSLRPVDGVFRAAAMLRREWQDVWGRFSCSPADWLGVDHRLHPGQPANFCLVRVSGEDELEALRVFYGGQEIT